MSNTDNTIVIITGTDPESAKGGIGVVMPGYIKALGYAGIECFMLPTYNPAIPKGKWLLWLKSFPVLIRLIRTARRNNKSIVVYSHVGDGLSFIRESCVLIISRLFGAKMIYQVHSPKVDGYLAKPLPRLLVGLALKPAHRVCMLTPWWSQRILATGLNQNKVAVIPNPLPDDLLEKAQQNKPDDDAQPSETITILSMARLVAGKGVDVVIQAMPDLPDNVHLVIAGDGDQRAKLEQLANDLNLNHRIQFLGWISGDTKTELLESVDIFCLPSTYDVFPMSMVEAMAFGLPVVAVKWGGIPDMVNDGEVGILAKQQEPTAITAAISQLLDPDKRYKMGVDAKQWVLDISDPVKVADKLKTVIADLIH